MGDGPIEKSSKKSITKVWPKPVYRHTNPYLNFLGEFRTAPENKGISVKDVFKAAAQKWKHLTPEDKTPYVNAAKNAKKEVKPVNSKKKIKLKKFKKKSLVEQKNTIKLAKLCTKCSKCGHKNRGDKFRETLNEGNKTDKKRTLPKKDYESSVSSYSPSQTMSCLSDSGETMFDSDASSISF